jgi:hypothetical protein
MLRPGSTRTRDRKQVRLRGHNVITGHEEGEHRRANGSDGSQIRGGWVGW